MEVIKKRVRFISIIGDAKGHTIHALCTDGYLWSYEKNSDGDREWKQHEPPTSLLNHESN